MKRSNSWILVLVIAIVAMVCQLQRPTLFTLGQPPAPQPALSRPPIQSTVLETAVSNTIGVDPSRGDSISVNYIDSGR